MPKFLPGDIVKYIVQAPQEFKDSEEVKEILSFAPLHGKQYARDRRREIEEGIPIYSMVHLVIDGGKSQGFKYLINSSSAMRCEQVNEDELELVKGAGTLS